jgi:hypothetical protein
MSDFVPDDVRHHVPYDWEEYKSTVVGTYGLLAYAQSVTEEAMRLEGACLAQERIAKAVQREFVTMTYAAGAGRLELDVHVRVCWVPKAEVDRILVEEHESATKRMEEFCKQITQLHAERAGMRRVLNVVRPVVERYATYAKEGCRLKCFAVRAILTGKKVPWDEEDWGLFVSGSELNRDFSGFRELSPYCENELLYVTSEYAAAHPYAWEVINEADQADIDGLTTTLSWRFWMEQIQRGSEGYMLVRGNWCKMTVDVAQGSYRIIDELADDVTEEEWLEDFEETGEEPEPSNWRCLHRWRLNKEDDGVVEEDQFATVLAMLERKWTSQNGHDDAFPFPKEVPLTFSDMLKW